MCINYEAIQLAYISIKSESRGKQPVYHTPKLKNTPAVSAPVKFTN